MILLAMQFPYKYSLEVILDWKSKIGLDFKRFFSNQRIKFCMKMTFLRGNELNMIHNVQLKKGKKFRRWLENFWNGKTLVGSLKKRFEWEWTDWVNKKTHLINHKIILHERPNVTTVRFHYMVSDIILIHDFYPHHMSTSNEYSYRNPKEVHVWIMSCSFYLFLCVCILWKVTTSGGELVQKLMTRAPL